MSSTQPLLRAALRGSLRLNLRTRHQVFKGADEWTASTVIHDFPVAETALLLCDVWNEHWCRGATERVDAMVPRMNQVVSFARGHGVQVIHAPSDTLDFYAESEPRERVRLAPPCDPPVDLPITDPPLPIDDSDGGCDTGEPPWRKAWSRQHPGIEIAQSDGISDNGREVYSLLRQLGIGNLIIMGVHTNMCVLGRSFGIRQMTRWGIRCVLVRDLTDAMYNPKMRPFVSHDAGTQLVIEHIEKYWCPSVLSDDLLAVHSE
ncbi:isochorismatase family protein [Candidatus Poribacteria bacterium]|nr:isochorismatase family protein [Candidatus Poribacteria bacterium]